MATITGLHHSTSIIQQIVQLKILGYSKINWEHCYMNTQCFAEFDKLI